MSTKSDYSGVIISLFFLATMTRGGSQLLESACPNIFNYRYDHQHNLYGEVQIKGVQAKIVQLNVELSIGNPTEGYNGKIELFKPKEQVLQDILDLKPIIYKVQFPLWRINPPRITKIIVNGNLICLGPPIPTNLVQVVTTVNLFHTLRVDILPLSSTSNTAPENSIFFEDSPPSYSTQLEGRGRPPPPNDEGQFGGRGRPPPPPPNDEGQFGGHGRPPPPPPKDEGQFGGRGRPPPPPPNDEGQFGGRGRPPPPPPNDEGQFGGRGRPPPPPPNDVGQFGGQKSQPPPLKKNWFKFNPVMPADPSEIYHGNPFLGTPAEKHYRPGGIFKELEEMQFRYDPTPASLPTHVKEEEEEDHPFQVSHRKEDVSSAHRGTNFSPMEESTPKMDAGVECGRPILTNSLISNGEAVPRGAYPWLGALYRIKPSGFLYVCSASLISNRHVVTAAHCVKNQNSQVLKPQELVIILGKLNLQRWGRYTEGEKMVEPESVLVHPDYKESSADADIAVLVLSEPVQFSKYVLPLCLWREDTDLQEIVGMEGVVVGWGKDLNGVLMTDEPKQTKLPIVSQESCLRSSYEFLHVTSNRTFCAGFRNGNGPCNGDSGSGFIMKRNGRWTLRGVVSTSLRDPTTRSCDLSNYVVFTDASKYLDWLISFIK